MRLEIIAATAACAFVLAVQPAAVAAETSKKASSARASSAKSAKPSRTHKSSPKRAASKRSSSRGKAAPAPAPEVVRAAPQPEVVVPLTPAQLQLAERVQTGVADCEFDQSVLIEPHTQRPGAFRVKYQKVTYVMVPEETSTGAVRLADEKAGVVWLQIPVKSMLMNARLGQRMVDACTSPMQRGAQAMAAAAAARHGADAAARGLGIDPTLASAGDTAAAMQGGTLRQASSLPLPAAAPAAAAAPLQAMPAEAVASGAAEASAGSGGVASPLPQQPGATAVSAPAEPMPTTLPSTAVQN